MARTKKKQNDDFDPVEEIATQIEPQDQRGTATTAPPPVDQTNLVTEKDGRTFRVTTRPDGGVDRVLVSRGRKPERCDNCRRDGTVFLHRVCSECKASTPVN